MDPVIETETTPDTTNETATETTPDTTTLLLTETAKTKVFDLLQAEANQDYYLRIAVQPGGCSGLRYAIYFDDRPMQDDVISKQGKVTVKVDRMSAPYLKGATLDWLERLDASGFTIENPNATGTCACGDSFH